MMRASGDSAAMFDAATKCGGANVTVADVVERAGVSRRTFYEIFEDSEDCFLAAFEQALDAATERVTQAYRAQGSTWREGVRAGLTVLLVFLDEDPMVGRLLVVESLTGSREVMRLRDEAIARVVAVIERGREDAKANRVVPSLMGEGIVGGVLSVIHSRLRSNGGDLDDGAPMVELINPLMGMIVLPYLGGTAARRELERPILSAPRRTVSSFDSSLAVTFKDAGLRLTYRTVRVLTAIGEHPGASNRVIADAADIKDQGQVSKLLTRLQRTEMVENSEPGPGQGAPNAWTLTPVGYRVVAALGAHNPKRNNGLTVRSEQ